MNAEEAKSYLGELLPGYTIRIEENYKGLPNNKYIFTKDGVDAAMLFARKLAMTREILNDVASKVRTKFDSPKVVEKKIDAGSTQRESSEQSDGPKPTELELKFYNAAKDIIKEFESKYPMT